MRYRIVVSHPFEQERDRVWAMLSDISMMTGFVGFGPIPGIQSAAWIDGDQLAEGNRRAVTNTDGTTHLETVVRVDPPRLIVDRIHDMTSPLRVFVREIEDRFELEPTAEGGTLMVRTFDVHLKSRAFLPIAALLGPALRRALHRHHRSMSGSLRND